MEFKEYKLGDIASFSQGKQVDINDQHLLKDKNMKRFLRIVDFTNPNETVRYVQNFGDRYFASEDDLVMIRYGSQTAGQIVIGKSGIIANNMFKINLNNEIADNKYLYYYLSQKRIVNYLKGSQSSSTMPAINFGTMNNIILKIPSLKNQKKIAKILTLIDKKIEINNRINENLQSLSQELYKRWFVDFEFPDENGKPYKSYDGKMVESELGEIPEGWLTKKISDLTNVFTGKKNANENNVDGKYKFFTCSPNNLMSDTYIFDGPAVIVAGNGAYTGRTRFYDGKFELYQRTYACTVKENIDTTNIYGLYIMMKLIVEPSYMGGTHGSAIPYIVMGDIADYKFSYDEKIFLDFSKIIENNIRKISNNENQNELLVKMRDSLLPKLMNGEIDLDKIEI